MNLSLEQKLAGVLVPVFALRGSEDQGIGDTAALIEFIDWAGEQGFRLVKILPINETGGDHSPYNAISSRALDPTTIFCAPSAIEDLGRKDYEAVLSSIDPAQLSSPIVDYSVVKPMKLQLLELAFSRFERTHLVRNTARGVAFTRFLRTEAEWIDDYLLFRALTEANGTECWDRWPETQRTPRVARAWLAAQTKLAAQSFRKRMRFFAYVQWIAFTQWRWVKAHAAKRGVALMGDIPFGVSYYSADVWAHPEFFRGDWSGGTPPDRVFKHDPFVVKWGQNWGIPLYDWDRMRGDGFRWWRQRVHGIREFLDLFRIDHVLGFYRIYGFPWRPERNGEFLPLSEEEARSRTGGELPHFQPRADDTPEHREQNRKEGEEYLRVVVAEAGQGRVIGEDLGEVPDYVRPNLTELGIAGYKIPAWERRGDNRLIPGSEYQRLSLVTYGTHDHEPLRAMWEHLAGQAQRGDENARHEMRILCEYAGFHAPTPPHDFSPELHEALLRALFQSNSWIAVAMITDLFGRSERFNFPGVAGEGNWTQRLHAPVSQLDDEPMLGAIRRLLRESGRAAA